ncbi:hypothetical protein LR48_Vigan11g098100 [Vigna angularis]|uniref:Uncharacterized protein n=1 Tax=Phaseolus angularis TaxID=3914 RepID=A0A0L9VSP6_PHAAN|nr:hypothetical protein LR48_Vigan11g098100 [Vigna angularis]
MPNNERSKRGLMFPDRFIVIPTPSRRFAPSLEIQGFLLSTTTDRHLCHSRPPLLQPEHTLGSPATTRTTITIASHDATVSTLLSSKTSDSQGVFSSAFISDPFASSSPININFTIAKTSTTNTTTATIRSPRAYPRLPPRWSPRPPDSLSTAQAAGTQRLSRH